MFQRLIRFLDFAGTIHFGELGNRIVFPKDNFAGIEVELYKPGAAPWDEDFRLTGQFCKIHKVLCPLSTTPQFLCVGLNYRQQAIEGNFRIPECPFLFAKPPDALAGPFDNIEIPSQAFGLDYEGEFCVVIGKDVKDYLPTQDLTPYILGYTIGNDVSSRYWQAPKKCGGQHGYAKSFDKFAPIGPVLVAPEVIPSLSTLTMTTRVNGEERQKTKLDDLIFDVATIVNHLSRGRTVRKGTIIMTGTPSGVGVFMKPEAVYLKSGDVVEVEVDSIGKIQNKFV